MSPRRLAQAALQVYNVSNQLVKQEEYAFLLPHDGLGDATEIERLAPIVRSRIWEILQLDPRKEVLALLDAYLAAVHLGEGDSPLASDAGVIITEITARTTDELTVGGPATYRPGVARRASIRTSRHPPHKQAAVVSY